jgi:HAE1 family hydrophobic/amphiphilic exporter-1/multidrug efflux pump
MENGYKNWLQKFMHHRFIAWVIVVLCGGLIFFIGKNLQSELAPIEDRGNIRFQITGPEGASYDYMTLAGEQLTDYIIDSVPETQFAFSSIPNFSSVGSNSGYVRLGMLPIRERKRSQSQLVKDVSKKLPRFNNVRIFPIEEQTISVGLSSRGSLPVQFVLQNLDFEKLKETIPKFLEEAKKDKTFQNVDVNLKFNKPEVDMTIDRMKAKDLGLSIFDISDVVQSAFSGRRLAYYTSNGKQYQVIGQVEIQNRQSPTDISKLYVRNIRGENIPLSAVVKIDENSNPPSLYHFNRFKAATISASLADGKTIGDGVTAMQNIANRILDETFQTSLSGASRDYAESSSNIAFAFILALVLIYLVLAAQFESFRDPLTIMITVPLALAGALLSLWAFNQTINIFSQIGMIMLIGLVTKNGILIVEFANKKQEQGLNKLDAVIEASAQRLRPILMTSLATALGALPIALSFGAASTSRIPLGIVIVGGITFSLILTLFVIPGIYMYISSTHASEEEIIKHNN